MMINPCYNGGLTREQFLFHEIRIVAGLLDKGYSEDEILEKTVNENLFQFPTERMIKTITNACFRRIDSLGSPYLRSELANASHEVAKQINLYAMMCYNGLVRDFMLTVIGEKFRTQSLDFSQSDINLFFFRLREQNDEVRSWSDSTVTKIKQVLKKSLVECSFLDSTRSVQLNPVCLFPELEAGIRENNDTSAFAAFNHFE